MRHLSGIVFIVLMVVLPSCKYFKGRGLFGKKADITVVWKARQDSIRVADSIRKDQDRLMAIENIKIDSSRKAEEARLAMDSKFNIIVGSFITPQYAKDMAAVYIKQGYDAQVIKMADSRFELVAAESHKSFSKAVKRLNAFQDTVQIDSWMYIKK